jgi:hypothetical protein
VLRRNIWTYKTESNRRMEKITQREAPYALYVLPNIIRRIRWSGHKACMGILAMHTFKWKNMKREGHLGNQNVEGRIILNLILNTHSVRVWPKNVYAVKGPVAGCCEHGNDPRVPCV